MQTRSVFVCFSLRLCTLLFFTKPAALCTQYRSAYLMFSLLRAPMASSWCLASVSSTESTRQTERSWHFWQNFNNHSLVKYRSVNGSGCPLIRQVRGRKRDANVEGRSSSSCRGARGTSSENRGICKWVAPINQHTLFVRGPLPFLAPNGKGCYNW